MDQTTPSQPAPSRHLSLILPAYNEQESIRRAIAEAGQALRRLVDRYEIIVVDDGSHDATAAATRRAMAQDVNVRLVSHSMNRGYGAALKSGFEAARYPLVAFSDADCQFHLEDLAHLIARIEDHDVVCGFRIERQDSWPRRFYSGCYNALVNFLLGVPVRDCDRALKLFRADILADLRIETDGFLVNAEMLARLATANRRISEVGLRHRARQDGSSTVSPLHAIPVALSLLRFWWIWSLVPQQSAEVAADNATINA